MKRFKLLGACGLLMLFMGTSCSITFHGVTEAPIGQKKGVAKGNDYSLRTAAKEGDIERVGAYKIRYQFFSMPKTTVYGTGD